MAQILYQNLEEAGLRSASFTYRTDEAPVVLDDFNLIIRKGETVAFTVHSGCGKSTVLKLLMCMYPLDSGERYITSAGNTQPLTTRFRRLFAYVPQGNRLRYICSNCASMPSVHI